MNHFTRQMRMIARRIGGSVRETALGGFVSKPDPAKPFATAWYYSRKAGRGKRLFVFLPIAYGDRDRLIPGIERLKPLLPPERIVRLAGGHNWTVWTAGLEKILAKIHWPEL